MIILLSGHIVKLPDKHLFIHIDLDCYQPWSKTISFAVGNSQCTENKELSTREHLSRGYRKDVRAGGQEDVIQSTVFWTLHDCEI